MACYGTVYFYALYEVIYFSSLTSDNPKDIRYRRFKQELVED
jgi:hypothetical protein